MTPEILGLVVVGCVLALAAAVGLFALMPKPPWLDRLWLWTIGAAFVFYVPIWIGLKIQDHGWKAVAIGVAGLFVAGFIKGWPAAGLSKS
jgi:threonine/homoserine/homoserine lactone efflux protein